MATAAFVGMAIVGFGFGFVVFASNFEARPACHSDAILEFLIALEKDGVQSLARCPPGSGFLPRICFENGTNSTDEVNNTTSSDDDEVLGRCERCGLDGRTYSTPEGVCRSCSSCTGGAQLRRNCNSTHDTWCECGKDHFRDEGQGKCRVCDPCPHGWGAAIPCTGTSNTVCRKCPLGTYSGVVSSTQDCIVCSSCRNDLVPVHECTPIQDTVCLGYSSSSVAYFEQKGKGKYGPTRHLLGDWSRLDGATVKVLVNTLRRIGRHDAVATVYSTGDGKLMEYVGELV